MDDSSPCTHPLNAAGLDDAGMARAVFVPDSACEQVGYRFETAMRMRGETGNVIIRVVGLKKIEQQERIEMVELR